MDNATPPPIQSGPPPPVQAEENHKPNIVKWLLIVAAVAALSSVATLLVATSQLNKKPATQPTPTPLPTEASAKAGDPTANWKTYINSENSYSIKYPSDTFVRLICPASEVNNLYLIKRTNETEDVINMPTCGRDGRYNIEFVVYDTFNEPKANENYAVTKEDVLIGGIKARRYTTTLVKEPLGPSFSFSEDLFVDYNGKLYLLHLGNKELTSTFDQILSTFKFIE